MAGNKQLFTEIEQMLRNYRLWQLKLAALEPRLVAPDGHLLLSRQSSSSRPTENLGIKRAELSKMIRKVHLILKALTKDERRFVNLRYFEEFSMKQIVHEMGWSKAEIYRLRISVLVKAAWLLNSTHRKPDTFFAQKPS